ncbi:MAG TPA: hypothetical protein VF541_21695, partial [Longimicrobium sp.]
MAMRAIARTLLVFLALLAVPLGAASAQATFRGLAWNAGDRQAEGFLAALGFRREADPPAAPGMPPWGVRRFTASGNTAARREAVDYQLRDGRLASVHYALR